MRVLQVASEAAPFAKTGGLADVVGALPGALSRLGCHVTVVIPAHREAFSARRFPVESTGWEFDVPVGTRKQKAKIFQSRLPGRDGTPDVTVYLVGNDAYFDRPTLYGGAEDYPDNSERFIFFSRAVLELANRFEEPCDIIHSHDWQTGLVPAYQKVLASQWPRLARARTLHTIHNMAYQGVFWHWDMLLTGIDWRYFNWQQMEYFGQLNLLKTGIVFADLVSTVSPTYAREIQSAPGGCSLEGVLSGRGDSLAGIVNGIDTDAWDPGNDPHLPRSYGEADVVEGKYAAKAALASRLGHVAPDPRPLIAFVGRLAEQKGIGLVFDLLGRLAGSGRARFLVLGTGDPRAEDGLRRLAASYPGTIDLVIGFDEGLAHLVQGAADMLLMPSLYEPCGLTQLYALRYGTIPIVRATGGLVDTVVDATPETLADGTASGFQFSAVDGGALAHAVERALELHADTDRWQTLVRRVMHEDWSWDASARKYLHLYQRVQAAPPTPVRVP
jgi:starch synthase